MTQEESNLLFAALVGLAILITFFVKLFEIAKSLKEISGKMPDKKEQINENVNKQN